MLMKHYEAVAYDPRKEEYPSGHDVLINCIGVSVDAVAHKANIDLWSEVIRINLIEAFRMTHYAIKDMRTRGNGRIIHLSSMLSGVTVIGTSAYSASKAGLNSMVRVVAAENKHRNILINSVNLGYIDAGMTLKIGEKGANIAEVIRICDVLIRSDMISGKSLDIW